MTDQLNLVIIGASKAGTTTVWEYLNRLDRVRMLSDKEPAIFSFSNWRDRLETYRDELATPCVWKGEASTIYSETGVCPEVPERIHSHNPDTRIVYVVREPVDRLQSAWGQTHAMGHQYHRIYATKTDSRDVPRMPTDFEEAIAAYPFLLEACEYHRHWSRFRDFFPENQMLLLFYEDLKEDPPAFYHKIHTFLSLGEVKEDMTRIWTNRRSQKRVEIHPRWKSLNRMLGFKSLLDRHPGVKENIRGLINSGKNLSPDIPRDLRTRIYRHLEPDIRKILAVGGKPRSYWPTSDSGGEEEKTKNR